jgi:hypothetical protein
MRDHATVPPLLYSIVRRRSFWPGPPGAAGGELVNGKFAAYHRQHKNA